MTFLKASDNAVSSAGDRVLGGGGGVYEEVRWSVSALASPQV